MNELHSHFSFTLVFVSFRGWTSSILTTIFSILVTSLLPVWYFYLGTCLGTNWLIHLFIQHCFHGAEIIPLLFVKFTTGTSTLLSVCLSGQDSLCWFSSPCSSLVCREHFYHEWIKVEQSQRHTETLTLLIATSWSSKYWRAYTRQAYDDIRSGYSTKRSCFLCHPCSSMHILFFLLFSCPFFSLSCWWTPVHSCQAALLAVQSHLCIYACILSRECLHVY